MGILDLARKLADCDTSFYGGWIMAGADIQIKGNAVQLSNKLLMHKRSTAIFEVKGTTAFGTETQRMRVFLVMPQDGANTKPEDIEYPGRMFMRHIFTKSEVDNYVAYTGDENIVHKGEKPLVPGLCMAAYLEQTMGLQQLNWRIAFKSPVYAGDELVVYAKDGQLTAFVGARLAFVVKE